MEFAPNHKEKKMIHRKNLVLIGAMLVLLGFANTPHAQTQKVRISLSSRSNTNTSYYVAQARGFFKDEALEVEFIQINPRLGAWRC
jgi:ABC-type nitrate/sulfonate/bicarbonate transport system substrate-binding protein